MRKKLNFKGKYWNNNTTELEYSINFKQKLLSMSKKIRPNYYFQTHTSCNSHIIYNKQTEKEAFRT